MRQNCFPISYSLFFIFMVVLSVTAIFVPASLAADALSGEEAPLRVKHVEIRGVKIRLPIPDGYEEMRREDHPETYDWLVKTNSDEIILPLAYLINSEDKTTLSQGAPIVGLRYGVARSEKLYWGDCIDDERLDYFKTLVKDFVRAVAKRVDDVGASKNTVPMDRSLLHEGKKSMSFLNVMQGNWPGFFYKTAYCKSFIVADKKIVEVTLWRDAYKDIEIQALIDDALFYLKKIDNSKY